MSGSGRPDIPPRVPAAAQRAYSIESVVLPAPPSTETPFFWTTSRGPRARTDWDRAAQSSRSTALDSAIPCPRPNVERAGPAEEVVAGSSWTESAGTVRARFFEVNRWSSGFHVIVGADRPPRRRDLEIDAVVVKAEPETGAAYTS